MIPIAGAAAVGSCVKEVEDGDAAYDNEHSKSHNESDEACKE